MYISHETTAKEIVENLAFALNDNQRSQLETAIHQFAIKQSEITERRNFEDRLRKQSKDPSQHWSLHSQDKQLIQDIADRLPAIAKANLMRLSYDDLKAVLKERETPVYDELKTFLKGEIVDRAYGYPIDFEFIMGDIDKPMSQAKLLQLVNQQKIFLPRAQKILDALTADFKVLEPDEEPEAI